MQNRRWAINLDTVLLVIALATVAGCSNSAGEAGQLPGNPAAPTMTVAVTPPPDQPSSTSPSNLALPVALSGINLRGVINPFGVVRSSLDRQSVGHPGIDIPSNTGASLFAVADGVIVSAAAMNDGLPGSAVRLLIAEGATPGTGWAFLYEHVTLAAGLGVDSRVTRGQLLATNAQDPAFTNHLELSWVFNDYTFAGSQTCWVPQLGAGAQASFTHTFDHELRTDQRFIDAWMSVTREGRLPFRELLNIERFPAGARPCYAPGTDVREP